MPAEHSIKPFAKNNGTPLLASLSDPPLRGKCALLYSARYGRSAEQHIMKGKGNFGMRGLQSLPIVQKTKAMIRVVEQNSLK